MEKIPAPPRFSHPGGGGVTTRIIISGARGGTTHNGTPNEEGDDDKEDDHEDSRMSCILSSSQFDTVSTQPKGEMMTKNLPSSSNKSSDYNKNNDHEDDRQLCRLRLVRSQALLYVSSYVICNVWTGIMVLIESSAAVDTPQEEKEAAVKYYGLLVLQSLLLPLQGFFNMLVYVRPKYLKCRDAFPEESKLWAFRRAIYGEEVEPTTVGGGGEGDACDHTPNTSNYTRRTGRGYVYINKNRHLHDHHDGNEEKMTGPSYPHASLLSPRFEARALQEGHHHYEQRQQQLMMMTSSEYASSKGALNEIIVGEYSNEEHQIPGAQRDANKLESEGISPPVASEASSSSSSRPRTTTASSTNRLVVGPRDITVSSLTISEVDCDEEEEEEQGDSYYGTGRDGGGHRDGGENTAGAADPAQPALSTSQHDERWDHHTEQDLSAWIPIKQGPRMLSSLRASSLGVISELSEVSFCEDVMKTTSEEDHSTSTTSAYDYDDIVVDFHDQRGKEGRWCTNSRGSSSPRPLPRPKQQEQQSKGTHDRHTKPSSQLGEQQTSTLFSISLRKPERTESSHEVQEEGASLVSESKMEPLHIRPSTMTGGGTTTMDTPMYIPKRQFSDPSPPCSVSSIFLKMPQRTESIVEEDSMVLSSPSCCHNNEIDNDVHGDIEQRGVTSCSSFDRMEAVSAPPSDRSTDNPIRVPTRRLSPTPTICQ